MRWEVLAFYQWITLNDYGCGCIEANTRACAILCSMASVEDKIVIAWQKAFQHSVGNFVFSFNFFFSKIKSNVIKAVSSNRLIKPMIWNFFRIFYFLFSYQETEQSWQWICSRFNCVYTDPYVFHCLSWKMINQCLLAFSLDTPLLCEWKTVR